MLSALEAALTGTSSDLGKFRGRIFRVKQLSTIFEGGQDIKGTEQDIKVTEQDIKGTFNKISRVHNRFEKSKSLIRWIRLKGWKRRKRHL